LLIFILFFSLILFITSFIVLALELGLPILNLDHDVLWRVLYISGWAFIIIAVFYYFKILHGYNISNSLRYKKLESIVKNIITKRIDKTNDLEKRSKDKINTGIHFLDSSLGGGVHVGDVIVFEGDIGNSLEDIMTHLLYAGLRKGYYSIYVAVSRPPEHVFGKYDEIIDDFNKDINFFIDAMIALQSSDMTYINNDENKRFWGMVTANFIYELERVALDYEKLNECKKKLHKKIKNNDPLNKKEIFSTIRKNLNLNHEIITNDKEVLPSFYEFIENDFLYIIDYNKRLIGEDESKHNNKYTDLFTDWRKYHSIDNPIDIENLHGCLRNIRTIIGDKRGAKPLWQVWDSTSTIFHLTVRDQDSLHKTMDFFFHQASSAKINNYIIFHSFKKGMHDEKYVRHLEHMADGVVDLYLKKGLTSTLFKFLRASKMKDADVSPVDTPYRIKNGFVEKMWW
jgi:archaellum biogenesis ATPase FlaH